MNCCMERMGFGKEVMPSDFDILVDSDAFTGLFVEYDAHHPLVTTAFERFLSEWQRLVTTSFVIAETATVISRLAGQSPARRFLTFVRSGNIPIIFIDEDLQDAGERIFIAQENKKTSMVDCTNVAVMERFHIPAIFSFDQVYFRKFHLKQAA